MEKDDKPCVWLSLAPIPKEDILHHFPNIYERCLEEGYDATKEPIPVVPAQHYFMGGVDVNRYSKTSMNRLYAAGETSCNGVHGKNRLASNSLLESLVFAKRAAKDIIKNMNSQEVNTQPTSHDMAVSIIKNMNFDIYKDYDKLTAYYKKIVLDEIERMKKEHEQHNNEVKC